jgi:hypothetical protein
MGIDKTDPIYDGVECYNCRFFKPTSRSFEHGECRRFPPVYTSRMVQTPSEDVERMQDEHSSTWVWRFPVVSAEFNDWCGEFQKHPMAPDDISRDTPSEWRHKST